MSSKCTKVEAHTRKGTPVKEYVRCTIVVVKKPTIDEVMTNAEQKFNDLDIDYFYSGQSEANGVSVYYKVKLKNQDENSFVKLRISDHSVTNINRIQDEIHFDLDVPNWSEYKIGGLMGKLNHPNWEYKKGPVTMPSGKVLDGFGYFKKS